MSNEPVAWRCWNMPDERWEITTVHSRLPAGQPLYTHPSEHDLGVAEAIGFDKGYNAATAKTLTDEEIEQLAEECLFVKENMLCSSVLCSSVGGYYSFARAILRKAQER